MLVGVHTIRFLYDWDRSDDTVFSIDGLVSTRNKPHAILDCVNVSMDMPHMVVVMMTSYHCLDGETEASFLLQNLVFDVSDNDGT